MVFLLPHKEFRIINISADVVPVDCQNNKVNQRHQAEDTTTGKDVSNSCHDFGSKIEAVNTETSQEEVKQNGNQRVFSAAG